MRRLPVMVGCAAALVMTLAGPAAAHADLESSEPANGAALPTAPSAIRMTFTEAVDPALSTVAVLNAGGAKLAVAPTTLDPPSTLTVSLPDDVPDGVYTVSWRVVSTDDGHVTAGAFAFGVGAAPGAIAPGAAPTTGTSGPTPLSVTAKTFLYAGLMLLVAVAVVGLWLFGGRPRSLRIVGLVGAMLAFAGAAGLLVAEVSAVGVPLDDLLRTPTGRPYGWLVIATLAAAACAVIAAARERWRAALWASGVAAGVAMAIRVSSGHASAAPDGDLQQAYQWLHFLAAGLWVGGLVLLLLLLIERSTGASPAGEARRFSTLALCAVAVVAVTGALRAVSELGGWSNLVDAIRGAYGVSLLVKIAVALMLIGVGATNRLRNVRRLEHEARPIRRMVAAEVVLAAGVLALTGVLTGFGPPASSAKVGQPVGPAGTAPVAGTATGAPPPTPRPPPGSRSPRSPAHPARTPSARSSPTTTPAPRRTPTP